MKVEIAPFEKLFNLAEARSLLPLIKKITAKHQQELEPIRVKLNKMLSNDPRRSSVEKEYEDIVHRWRLKVEKLGASVNGLWIVEFNVGSGALSWRNPELGLNYFREAGKEFSSRIKLSNYIEECDPDWAH